MNLNWKLILLLSGFGLAMAIATVWWIPGNIEFAFWLGIFIFCAYMVAQQAPGKYFLHGLILSMVNCIWVTSAHILFFTDYAATHPDEMEMSAKMTTNPRMVMAFMGPIFGAVMGLVLGLFCYIAAKIAKK